MIIYGRTSTLPDRWHPSPSRRLSPWSRPMFFLLACGIVAFSRDANASGTGVSVEGVSNYSVQGSGNIDCYSQAHGFLAGLSGHGGFTTNVEWYDNNVFDSDFLDPDCSGCDSRDTDTYGFDAPGSALSFVCSHGLCDDKTTTACTTSSQCSGGYCPGTPPASASSACIRNSPRDILTSSST
jgi:hypothetical protein